MTTFKILTITKAGSRKTFRRRVHEDGAQLGFNWLRHSGTNYEERGRVFRQLNGNGCPKFRAMALEVCELAEAWAGEMRGMSDTIKSFKQDHGL